VRGVRGVKSARGVRRETYLSFYLFVKHQLAACCGGGGGGCCEVLVVLVVVETTVGDVYPSLQMPTRATTVGDAVCNRIVRVTRVSGVGRVCNFSIVGRVVDK
jgi:hypothetical protein